jgi:hypothetical protein
MRKLAVIFILVSLFLSLGAAAEGFKVDVTGFNTTVDPATDNEARFYVDITNTGEENTTYRVSYGNVLFPSWYFLDRSSVRLTPGEIGRSTLYVNPKPDAVAGSYGSDIIVHPSGEPSNAVRKTVAMSIKQNRELLISGFRGVKAMYGPREMVEVSIDLKNVVQKDLPANQYRVVMELTDDRSVTPIPAIDGGDTETMTASLQLQNYRPGIYDLSIRVETVDGDIHSRRTARIQVDAVPKVVSSVESKKRIMQSSVTIIKQNKGNTVTDSEMSYAVAWYKAPFVDFSRDPDRTTQQNGEKVFTWNIKGLAPGEVEKVTVTTNYWPLLAVALIVLISLYILYSHFRRVSVVKKATKQPGFISVHLRVKNNTGDTIERVQLHDFAPGLAKVIEKFDGRGPDTLQPTDEGTKLVWELDEMEEGEERIISYKLKPKVQVEGHISLPAANVEYFDGGKEYAENSHPVSVDFR